MVPPLNVERVDVLSPTAYRCTLQTNKHSVKKLTEGKHLKKTYNTSYNKVWMREESGWWNSLTKLKILNVYARPHLIRNINVI